MVPKHVAFAPASQKQLGSRLRSPLLRRATVPAQPFSRFFHHTAFAQQGNPMQSGRRRAEKGDKLLFLQRRGLTMLVESSSRKSSLSPFSPSMSEQGELRSRREERMENGVKNLKGSEAISQILF
jgi:hypothetical protein